MNSHGRRGFLKGLTLAGAAAAAETPARAQKTGKPADSSSASSVPDLVYPRVYSGAQLNQISYPLGGIGTGSIGLGGRGQFRDWEVYNHPSKGNAPLYSYASLYVQSGSASPFATCLEARLQPPFGGALGLGTQNAPGIPRMESAQFTGEFPVAHIDFQDSRIPVTVSLDAFSPFIPQDEKDSAIPVAVLRYTVTNSGPLDATVAVAYSLDNPLYGVYPSASRVNTWVDNGQLKGYFMTNPGIPAADPVFGTFGLFTLAPDGNVYRTRGWDYGLGQLGGALRAWNIFAANGTFGAEPQIPDKTASLCVRKTVPAGGKADFTFLLTWSFPNRILSQMGWDAAPGFDNLNAGNYYSQRFPDAQTVAQYVSDNLPSLEARTRAFSAAMRQSTLPGSVRDAAMQNLSTLVSGTCFRAADGTFNGFEGAGDWAGYGFGNCKHVWSYEAALAPLFPVLSKSMRDTAFGFSTDADGKMDLRDYLPRGRVNFPYAAADGQMAQIVKLYMDWKQNGDTAWLIRTWPAAKRALEYAWKPGGWDADRDGVMEGIQSTTYDTQFYGPNPLCTGWYLAALRAAEEMAGIVGDTAAGTQYRRVFIQGSAWVDANLFNGEYYVQKLQLSPGQPLAGTLMYGKPSAETSIIAQLFDGCLIDQLVGQFSANIAGLGLILDSTHIAKALEAIYRYNYKRGSFDQVNFGRAFILNDEAGCIVCDYTKGTPPAARMPYISEVMSGFEYSAAILMMQQGMQNQGIELITNIRKRYNGERRNPWDEAEFGHSYSRAMASWAAIQALSGFTYQPQSMQIAAKPSYRADDFHCFWSSGQGWGTFTHVTNSKGHTFTLRLQEGKMECASVELAWPVPEERTSSASLDSLQLPHAVHSTSSGAGFAFPHPVVLRPGQTLRLSLRHSALVIT